MGRLNFEDPLDKDDPLDEQAELIAEALWIAGYTDFTVKISFGSTDAIAHSPDRQLVTELREDLEPDAGDLFNWFASMDESEAS